MTASVDQGGLLVAAVVLMAFVTYMGWTRELFARQPIYRSWWMWLGPVIVLIPIVLRLFGIDWGGRAVEIVALVMATGLLIGFVEELTYRGIAVKLLRDGGHGERVVALISSLFFGLSHSVNIFSGQSVTTVATTMVYTFGFGVLMYLSLRSIGFLVGAMVLHGLTEPTTILVGGGLDKVATGQHRIRFSRPPEASRSWSWPPASSWSSSCEGRSAAGGVRRPPPLRWPDLQPAARRLGVDRSCPRLDDRLRGDRTHPGQTTARRPARGPGLLDAPAGPGAAGPAAVLLVGAARHQ